MVKIGYDNDSSPVVQWERTGPLLRTSFYSCVQNSVLDLYTVVTCKSILSFMW